jgi:site-specific DNA-cytosine methylase
MPKKNSYITVTDQFCGAGGSSQGVRRLANKHRGGLEVKLALNHWKLAIETHNTNFPRRYPSTDSMLKPGEIKLAMAFDGDYVVLGSGKDQVKQLGNAVTPPAMEWLVQQVVESLK